MFSALRLAAAAAAIAVVGFAGTASAKPAQIQIGPNKLIVKLCKPHYETKTNYVGIRRIGFKYYRVYRVMVVHVNALCHKRVVRVHYRYVPLPWYRHNGVGA